MVSSSLLSKTRANNLKGSGERLHISSDIPLYPALTHLKPFYISNPSNSGFVTSIASIFKMLSGNRGQKAVALEFYKGDSQDKIISEIVKSVRENSKDARPFILIPSLYGIIGRSGLPSLGPRIAQAVIEQVKDLDPLVVSLVPKDSDAGIAKRNALRVGDKKTRSQLVELFKHAGAIANLSPALTEGASLIDQCLVLAEKLDLLLIQEAIDGKPATKTGTLFKSSGEPIIFEEIKQDSADKQRLSRLEQLGINTPLEALAHVGFGVFPKALFIDDDQTILDIYEVVSLNADFELEKKDSNLATTADNTRTFLHIKEQTLEQIVSELNATKYDLTTCDYDLKNKNFNGINVLNQVLGLATAPSCVALVTNQISEPSVCQGFFELAENYKHLGLMAIDKMDNSGNTIIGKIDQQLKDTAQLCLKLTAGILDFAPVEIKFKRQDFHIAAAEFVAANEESSLAVLESFSESKELKQYSELWRTLRNEHRNLTLSAFNTNFLARILSLGKFVSL